MATKRMRTNKKVLSNELQKLTALSNAGPGNEHSRTAMCLGAAYAIGWILGEFDSPSVQILAAVEKKKGGR